MGETTTPGVEEAEAAAERLEAALARIAEGLARPVPEPGPAPEAGPDTAMPGMAILAARLDGLIERVRAELTASAGVADKMD
jgi:hypothetical protein